MVFSVSLNRSIHRGDSTLYPVVTTADYGTIGKVKFEDFLYVDAAATPFELLNLLPNRSIKNVPVLLRQMITPTFIGDANITQTGANFTKTSGTGYDGKYYDTALSQTKCSIEAKSVNFSPAGISLQNGNVTIVDDYANAAVGHSITLQPELVTGSGFGQIEIRERGVLIPNRETAFFQIGDKVLIELDSGVVRYYLVRPTGQMILLRAVRSNLSAAPKAQVMLYTTTSTLQNVYVFNNAETSTSFEMIGVLENFQDWQNDFAHVDQGQAIQMSDNQPQFTYPGKKPILRNLGANLNMRTKTQRDLFLKFFRDHGQAREFIFIDNAHKDENGNNTEFFARFGPAFGDKARGSCLSAHNATIVETDRSQIVPKQTRPPPVGFPADLLLFGGIPMLFRGTYLTFAH
jgi:hypothetical protein